MTTVGWGREGQPKLKRLDAAVPHPYRMPTALSGYHRTFCLLSSTFVSCATAPGQSTNRLPGLACLPAVGSIHIAPYKPPRPAYAPNYFQPAGKQPPPSQPSNNSNNLPGPACQPAGGQHGRRPPPAPPPCQLPRPRWDHPPSAWQWCSLGPAIRTPSMLVSQAPDLSSGCGTKLSRTSHPSAIGSLFVVAWRPRLGSSARCNVLRIYLELPYGCSSLWTWSVLSADRACEGSVHRHQAKRDACRRPQAHGGWHC